MSRAGVLRRGMGTRERGGLSRCRTGGTWVGLFPSAPPRAPGEAASFPAPRSALRAFPASPPCAASLPPRISPGAAASSSLGHSSHRSPRSIPRGGSTSLHPSLPPSFQPRFPRSPSPGGGRAGHSLQRGRPPRTGFAAWLLRPPGQRRPGAPPLRGNGGEREWGGDGSGAGGKGGSSTRGYPAEVERQSSAALPPFSPKAVDLRGARIPRLGTPALCSFLRSAPTPAV